MKHVDGWWCPDVLSGPGKFLRRSAVIGEALKYWHGERRCVVQAGGHIGIWPRMLAQYFERVVCFEPEPANWECLVCNTAGSARIQRVYGVLGETDGIALLSVQPRSTGGHHIAVRTDRPYVKVPMYRIDDFYCEEKPISAIFVDIEGYELPALKGAQETLKRWHPLVVAEENSCARRYGQTAEAIADYLAAFGYAMIGEYGEDRVYIAAQESSI